MPVVLVGGVVQQRHRDTGGNVTAYSIRWPDGRVTLHPKGHVQVAPPDWAQAEGEEWRRVPSTTLVAYHPADRLWIAEDLTRRGCWASGVTPTEAFLALGAVGIDYDETLSSPHQPEGVNPWTT